MKQFINENKGIGAAVAAITTISILANAVTRKEKKELEGMKISDMTGKQFNRLQQLVK